MEPRTDESNEEAVLDGATTLEESTEGDGAQPETVIIGDQEFSLEEALELVKAGRDAKTFVASATQKAQEAARQREEAEALRTQLADVKEFYDFLTELPIDQQDELKQFVARIGLRDGKAPPYEVSPQAIQSGAVPPPLEIDLDQLSDGERQVYEAMSRHTQRLEAHLVRQGHALASLKDVAEFARAKIGEETAMAKAEAGATALKTLGYDVAASDVLAAMKQTGLQDPEAAWAKAHLKSIAAGQKGAAPPQRARARPPGSPGTSASKRTPSGSADDVFAALERGELDRNSIE